MFSRRIERIIRNEFFYHTYDITTAVVHGENVFGVELGNGWYNQKDKINEKKLWYGYPKLLFQIEIEYADGDKDVFISDENTKWHESPRIYNNIYFEKYMMHVRRV